MKLQAVTADAQVQRQVCFESMLEVDAEPEEIKVELAGLGFVEDAQDGNGFFEGRALGFLVCQ